MKKSFIILALSTVLSVLLYGSVSAQEYTELYNPDKCTNTEYTDADLIGYKVYEGDVYYDFCLMEGVDSKTITPLIIGDKESFDYGQDKNNVYYRSRLLKGLNPYQFDIKSIGRYGTILYDNDTIYFNGTDITNANPDLESLEQLEGGGYYRDKDFLYRYIITDTTPSGIENISFAKVEKGDPDNYGRGYKITDDAVYWYGEKIEEADVGSFEVFYKGFAKDKNNVYKDGDVIYGVDTKSFQRTAPEGVGIYIYADKNKSYYGAGLKTINEIKKEIPESKESLNSSIKTALIEYKEKYPGYRPQPAIDPDNPPKHPTLDRIWDIITDYKYLNPPVYYLIILSPVLLVLGVVGFVVWRRKRKK